MRQARIEEENRYQLRRQRDFRRAADLLTDAWIGLPEVQAIAVIGSVAKPLWKEVPRFSEFRRAGIEIWHECGDLDMALWLDDQSRLSHIRRLTALALRKEHEADPMFGVPPQQVDVFLIEPGTDRYIGRLCHFNSCPKDKRDCLTPGCGDIPFNKVFPDFQPEAGLLAPAAYAMLYQRGRGRLRSALELPSVMAGEPEESPA